MTLTVSDCNGLLSGQTLRDDVIRGLHLRGFPTRKIWYYRYRTARGLDRYYRLGPYPGLTIKHARDAAQVVIGAVAAGRDPSQEKQEKRKQRGLTVNVLCDLYIKLHLPKKAAYSAKTDLDNINRYIRRGLGTMVVADVTRRDVQKFLDDVLHRRIHVSKRHHFRATVPITSNRVRALLSTMFDAATTDGYGPLRKEEQGNPVHKTTKHPEYPRRRIAQPHELEAVCRELDRLAAQYPRQVAALWSIIFVGARKNEIVQARVENRQPGNGVFRGDRLVLPKHKTARKAGAKTIHLPEQVTRILDSLPPADNGLLFGKNVDGVWRKAREAAGCPDLTIHDMRRTYVSIAVGGGAGLPAIGKLVGHSNAQTTNAYAFLMEDDSRQLAQSVANKVEGWMRPALPAPAVPDCQDAQHHHQANGSPEQEACGRDQSAATRH